MKIDMKDRLIQILQVAGGEMSLSSLLSLWPAMKLDVRDLLDELEVRLREKELERKIGSAGGIRICLPSEKNTEDEDGLSEAARKKAVYDFIEEVKGFDEKWTINSIHQRMVERKMGISKMDVERSVNALVSEGKAIKLKKDRFQNRIEYWWYKLEYS